MSNNNTIVNNNNSQDFLTQLLNLSNAGRNTDNSNSGNNTPNIFVVVLDGNNNNNNTNNSITEHDPNSNSLNTNSNLTPLVSQHTADNTNSKKRKLEQAVSPVPILISKQPTTNTNNVINNNTIENNTVIPAMITSTTFGSNSDLQQEEEEDIIIHGEQRRTVAHAVMANNNFNHQTNTVNDANVSYTDLNSNHTNNDHEQNVNTLPIINKRKGKLIQDRVHEHVMLPMLAMDIIDTEEFQRLRNLKQLGTTVYLYPGATHTRFEHSIGVAHLAGETVRFLRNNQPELNIDEKDVLCVIIAGLCHDVGHGPFSHLFELVINRIRREEEANRYHALTHCGGKTKYTESGYESKYTTHRDESYRTTSGKRREAYSCARNNDRSASHQSNLNAFNQSYGNNNNNNGFSGVSNTPHANRSGCFKNSVFFPSASTAAPDWHSDHQSHQGLGATPAVTASSGSGKKEEWHHEQMSLKLLRQIFHKVDFASYGLDEKDLNFIELCIIGLPPKQPWPGKEKVGRGREKRFLAEIVANKRHGIDVDKLDYFLRDSLGIYGRSAVNIHVSRLLSACKVLEYEGEVQICYEEKMALNLGDIFAVRAKLHKYAYQHRIVKITDYMVSDILTLANDHFMIKSYQGNTRGRESQPRWLRISDCVDDVDAFIKLGDWILPAIAAAENPALAKAQEILHRLNTRNLYSIAGAATFNMNFSKNSMFSKEKVEMDVIDYLCSVDEHVADLLDIIATLEAEQQSRELENVSGEEDEENTEQEDLYVVSEEERDDKDTRGKEEIQENGTYDERYSEGVVRESIFGRFPAPNAHFGEKTQPMPYNRTGAMEREEREFTNKPPYQPQVPGTTTTNNNSNHTNNTNPVTTENTNSSTPLSISPADVERVRMELKNNIIVSFTVINYGSSDDEGRPDDPINKVAFFNPKQMQKGAFKLPNNRVSPLFSPSAYSEVSLIILVRHKAFLSKVSLSFDLWKHHHERFLSVAVPTANAYGEATASHTNNNNTNNTNGSHSRRHESVHRARSTSSHPRNHLHPQTAEHLRATNNRTNSNTNMNRSNNNNTITSNTTSLANKMTKLQTFGETLQTHVKRNDPRRDPHLNHNNNSSCSDTVNSNVNHLSYDLHDSSDSVHTVNIKTPTKRPRNVFLEENDQSANDSTYQKNYTNNNNNNNKTLYYRNEKGEFVPVLDL